MDLLTDYPVQKFETLDEKARCRFHPEKIAVAYSRDVGLLCKTCYEDEDDHWSQVFDNRMCEIS